MKRSVLIGILSCLLLLCACQAGWGEPAHEPSDQMAPAVTTSAGAEGSSTLESAVASPEAQASSVVEAPASEPPSTMPMPISRDPETVRAYLATISNDYQALKSREDLVVESPLDGPSESGWTLWKRFYSAAQAGEAAAVTIVRFTTEGDAIPCYLHCNGSDFYLMEDTNRDAFGAGAYYEYTYSTLTESRYRYGIIREDHYEMRTELQYTLSGPISAASPASELLVLYGLEGWEDMGIPALPEPTRDETAIRTHLAAFPEELDSLCDMDRVVLRRQGAVSSNSQTVWDIFTQVCDTGEPYSMTLVDLPAEGGPVLTYISYDGQDFLLVEDRTRSGGQITSWTLEDFSQVQEYAQMTSTLDA